MLYGKHAIPFRLFTLIALSIGVWGCFATSPVEAGTCGDYLHTAKDQLAQVNGETMGKSSEAQNAASMPVRPCKGPRCGRNPGLPASPPPVVRFGQPHELLLCTSADFELNELVDFRRMAIGSVATDGYPSRVKRPPRCGHDLLS